MKDGDTYATRHASTTAGLQEAIDALEGGKGKVFIGPGTLETTAAIWLHSYCHLQGSGMGQTIIKRATGSLTDGDAANSGAVFSTSAYGSNGTLSSSSAIQYDIQISDLSIDGNEDNFSSLTVNTGQYGLHCKSVDGLTLRGVKFVNTLLSACFLNECRRVVASNIVMNSVAQWSVSGVNNGFDFYNDSAGTTGHGQEFSCTNFYIKDVGFSGGPGAEAFSVTRADNVTISNGFIDGCDQAFEFQGGTGATTQEGFTVSNVVAINLRQEAVVLAANASGGITQKATITGCVFEGHSSLHNARMVNIEGSSAGWAKQIAFSNCVFRNINTADTTSRNWVDLSQTGSTSSEAITFSNCSFQGLAASTRTGDTGFQLNGNLKDVSIVGCVLKDVPGRGFYLHDGGTRTLRDISLSDCLVDGCNGRAYDITTDGSLAGTVTEIRLNNCVAKDAQRQGSGTAASFIVGSGDSSTGSFSNVYLFGCRAYVTTGSTMTHGLQIYGGTATTPSGLWIDGCFFTGATAPMVKQGSGTWSNIYFSPRTGLGTAIASAATIAIPTDGEVFHVTGTTNITNGVTVNAWDNGRIVTLIFDDILTMSDTGTSVLSAAYVTTANDTLTLRCDGTNWYEVSRSAN